MNTNRSDVQEKLAVLLDYWIEHNKEHEEEFLHWAREIARSSAGVAQQLQKAATKMAAATDELVRARQALPKSKEKH